MKIKSNKINEKTTHAHIHKKETSKYTLTYTCTHMHKHNYAHTHTCTHQHVRTLKAKYRIDQNEYHYCKIVYDKKGGSHSQAQKRIELVTLGLRGERDNHSSIEVCC